MIKFKEKYKKLTEEQYNDFIYMIDSYKYNLNTLNKRLFRLYSETYVNHYTSV